MHRKGRVKGFNGFVEFTFMTDFIFSYILKFSNLAVNYFFIDCKIKIFGNVSNNHPS